jgi:DNA topoisomerase-6 subunit A
MTFKDQSESDNVITDLETVSRYAREDFNVFPEERSAIFGDLTIEYTVPGYEGKRLNLTSHPDGVMIGPALTSSEFVKTSADKVIAIEKGGLFTRFVEEQVHKKYNAVLVLTAGQAPRATRHFIRRLNQELDLPVFIFTDGDPWGMHIAMVIISGSANAAHLRELTTPDAKWSGVWASDIVDYKLPSDPLTDIDMKRLSELQKDPRYEGALWQRETKTFIKIRKKAEQEAFSRYGLTYIVDEYLPAKLEESEKL